MQRPAQDRLPDQATILSRVVNINGRTQAG